MTSGDGNHAVLGIEADYEADVSADKQLSPLLPSDT